MDELRINAAFAELQNIQALLTQRCVNLAGDLAAANAKIIELTPKEPKLNSKSKE